MLANVNRPNSTLVNNRHKRTKIIYNILFNFYLQRTGAQYEIRSHDRRLVSTKHEDLQTILRHLNIQVDNPIVVLNQETSRNFLQSKNAKDKYQFFMKATQLEEIKENYRQTAEDYKQATRNLESKSEVSVFSLRQFFRLFNRTQFVIYRLGAKYG